MRLSETMKKLRETQRKGFVAYLTAGDPNLLVSEKVVLELAAQGADVIELGVPFSDPVADGPVNQRAAERALKAGVKLGDVLALAKKVREAGCATPLVLFTYLNPILAMGLDSFAAHAQASGISGALVVDLPVEESESLVQAFVKHGLENVFLAAPTTAPERLGRIDAASTGFVYYVSRTGVTGEQSSLSGSLASEVQRLRQNVRGPVAIGFGISGPEQAREAARFGDAIVIGSAIVRLIEQAPDPTGAQAVKAVGAFAKSVRQALDLPL